jgi:hypothetical protein
MEPHKCPPKWKVWDADEDESSAGEYFDTSPNLAVERWADECASNCDYHLLNGGEDFAMVRGEDGSVKKYKVTGEVVAKYTAEKIG